MMSHWTTDKASKEQDQLLPLYVFLLSSAASPQLCQYSGLTEINGEAYDFCCSAIVSLFLHAGLGYAFVFSSDSLISWGY